MSEFEEQWVCEYCDLVFDGAQHRCPICHRITAVRRMKKVNQK
jgi:rubrerythrin